MRDALKQILEMETLIKKANQLKAKHQFSETERLLEQALSIDPNNQEAIALLKRTRLMEKTQSTKQPIADSLS